jgi:cytochrome P450
MLRNRPEGFRRPARVQYLAREMGADIGLFMAEGAEWRSMRAMMTASLSPRQLRVYFSRLKQIALRLRSRWSAAAGAGAAIDLNGDLKRYMVDAVSSQAFGTDVNTLEAKEDPIHCHIEFVMAMLYRRIMLPIPYWRLFSLPADRRLARSVAEIKRATTGFIEAARAQLGTDPTRRNTPANVLEAMIVAADQPGSGLDDDAVAGNALDLLLAGEITTSNALAWLIWLLHRNPEVLRRAAEEIDAAVPSLDAITMEQLEKLHYVEACVCESLRFKPVEPMLLGEAERDLVLGDVAVPAGTVIMGLQRVEGLDDRWFADALRFDPERWLGGAGPGRRNKSVSIPFGAGPRICVGRSLALIEIKLGVAVLLRGFTIEALDAGGTGEPEEIMGAVLAPSAMALRLRTRSPG